MNLARVSDDEVLSKVSSLCVAGNRLTARLLVYLGEVEARRLDLKAACSSMFDYCTRRLGMSEGEAYRRLTAARLVHKFPSLLGAIERGEVHLSALAILAKHMTAENVDELVAAARGKTKLEVQEIAARLAPKPDVRESLTRMHDRSSTNETLAIESVGAPVAPAPSHGSARSAQRIEPLAEDRYLLTLTVSKAVKEKLERAKDLMRHRNVRGDGEVVVEEALDVLIAKLEKDRFGKATRPRTTRASRRKGYIPRGVRREVFERDGERCTFVDDDGRRCEARSLLELDHIEPQALGGADDAANLRVRCRAHNKLHAEDVFGPEHIARSVHFSQRKSQNDSIEKATRGLVNMGFETTAVRRAVASICARRGAAPPVEQLLRETIAALT